MASDVKIEVTRFALSTAAAGNTQDVTISGFGTVKAAIFITSGGITDDSIGSYGAIGIGFTDGTNQSLVCSQMADGTASSDTSRRHSTAALIGRPTSPGTAFDFAFALNSFITDGVRLTISTATSAARLVTCILIGGADVTAHVGTKDDLGTGTSAVDINTVGFAPDIVFLSTSSQSTALPNGGTAGLIGFGIGVNDGVPSQASVSFVSSDAVADSTVTAIISNAGALTRASASTPWTTAISDFDASGFSLTPNASTASAIVSYLCLQIANSPDIYLGDMSWPTSGNYAETGPGFTPTFGLITSLVGPTARNSNTSSSVAGLSIAAFDASAVYTHSITDEDAAATMVAKSLSSDQLRILHFDGATDSVLGSKPVFDSQGWDCTITTNPVTNPVLGFALAIGAGATGAYELTPVAATVTITGGALTLSAARDITPSAATVTVTGAALTLDADRVLDLTAATVAVTGGSLVLTYTTVGAYSLDILPATIAVTGAALTLNADRSVSPVAATVAVTGAALALDADRVLEPLPASVAVTGAALTLTYTPLVNKEITPLPATVAVTGGVLTLTYGAINNYVMSPMAASVIVATKNLKLEYSGVNLSKINGVTI